MFEGVREQFQGELDEIAARRALQARARDRLGAGRPRDARRRPRGAEPLRQQLPRPRQPPGGARGRARRARRARLRHGVGALHLRHAGHPQRARGAAQRVPRHRGHDPLLVVLRRQRRASSRRCSASEDAIISDALNHASIIDGIRLCKARRLRYANGDTADLEAAPARGGRRAPPPDRDRRRVLDGRLRRAAAAICDLAEKYGAMVMVDDSHAVGFMGPDGRGTPALHGVAERVDLVTGTLGKALGGASGGYTSGRREAIELLRQRSRPYLFSNTLAAADRGGAASRCSTCSRRGRRAARAAVPRTRARFRASSSALGLDVVPGRAPDRAGDVRRRAPRRGCGRAPARARRLRRRVLLPRRAAGQGAHPHPALGGALDEDVDRAIAAFAEVARA